MNAAATATPGEDELAWLRRCLDLAAAAREAGDGPFGSVLVDGDGQLVAEARNTVNTDNDVTAHPELKLARLAGAELSPQQRAAATVYTSGEHCPMCAAAHGWVGLGSIVYATSSKQLTAWRQELGVAPPPVRPLQITDVVPGAVVDGPVPELEDEVRELHDRYHATARS